MNMMYTSARFFLKKDTASVARHNWQKAFVVSLVPATPIRVCLNSTESESEKISSAFRLLDSKLNNNHTQNAQELKVSIDRYNQKQYEMLCWMDQLTESDSIRFDETSGQTYRETVESFGYGRIPPMIHEEFWQSNMHATNSAAAVVLNEHKDLATSVLYKGHMNAKCFPWLLAWMMLQKRRI